MVKKSPILLFVQMEVMLLMQNMLAVSFITPQNCCNCHRVCARNKLITIRGLHSKALGNTQQMGFHQPQMCKCDPEEKHKFFADFLHICVEVESLLRFLHSRAGNIPFSGKKAASTGPGCRDCCVGNPSCLLPRWAPCLSESAGKPEARPNIQPSIQQLLKESINL